VRAVAEERLGTLVLTRRELRQPPAERCITLLLEEIQRRGITALHWTEKAVQLWRRLELAAQLEPAAGWPDPGRLAAEPGLWLGTWLHGVRSWRDLQRIDLHAALLALLDWDQRQWLERMLPVSLALPGRPALPVYYGDEGVMVEGLVQDFYGQATMPVIAGGRLRLTLQLLSPARRPVARTADLANFWSGAYREVRKEMRGRYPKHYWPEEPARARPVHLQRQL
jgi:ATP-dependent helicase HrpB